MSFKIEVQMAGEWGGSNALAFATHDEAKDYGTELLSRWSGPDDFRVIESTEPVNYRFDKETYKAVKLIP